MRFFVGFNVWEKLDMIGYLCDSIARNFPPEQLHFGILFDDSPECAEAFQLMRQHFFGNHRVPVTVVDHRGQPEVREVGGHNLLLKQFMQTECEMALIFQDDQRLNRPIHETLAKLCDRNLYPNLGVVTGRDGYDAHFQNMVSSEWSESLSQRRIPHGAIEPCQFMNTGPIGYRRDVVEKVGFLCEDFTGMYSLDEYAARCMDAGLENQVMGVDLTHAKFGRVKATWWLVDGKDAAHDEALLKSKTKRWG